MTALSPRVHRSSHRSPAGSAPRTRSWATTPETLGLVALSGLLDSWDVARNGWANEYYSAAAQAMAGSWHDFLFGSMDVRGVMTVDKPPLALWVQALSVRVFGMHPLAMLLPQAVMGVASVLLLAAIVRTAWGRIAGLVAGVAFALMPITVAIFRHDNPDALLITCTLAALWSTQRALRSSAGARWMTAAGVCIGLAFETKMGAGLLAVPALLTAWLWCGRSSRRARLAGAATCSAAALIVGAAWPVLVSLTPTDDRPWISGTSDNSVWSLIVGYNGAGRVTGQAGGPGGGFGGGIFGGSPGPLRLLDSSLGGQAGWFVALALAVLLLGAVQTRLRPGDPRTGSLLLVGGTFAACAVVFSLAGGIFHPYYVSLLAPFAAGLVGIGAGLLTDHRSDARVVGPALACAGAGGELVVLHDALGLGVGHALLVLGLTALAATGLAVARSRTHLLLAGTAVLVILGWAPAAWAFDTLGHAADGTFPAGGPAAQAQAGPNFGGDTQSLAAAVTYTTTNGGGGIAVGSQSTAASAILAGDDTVVGIGGFSGAESGVNAAWLASEVAHGRIRWVLTTSDGMGVTGGRVGSTAVMVAVEASCTETAITGLYDCAGRTSELRAYRPPSNDHTGSLTTTTTGAAATRR